MAGELLLDTSALVSLLDRAQQRHKDCVAFFQRWTGRVVSTEAVLTESAHLLSRVSHGPEACCSFFLDGGALLVPSTQSSLRRCRELMETYRDQPMGFADATLVVLAEELGTQNVFTTDRRDFGIYRIGGRKRFSIKP